MTRSSGRRRIYDNYKIRGTPLIAAALIVNLVFAMLLLTSVLIQLAYAQGGWSLMTAPGVGTVYFSLSVVGGGGGITIVPEGWAVGTHGMVSHYTAGVWGIYQTISMPWGPPILHSVHMASPSDVWAVGQGGTILHYDGTSWSTASSPTTADLFSVYMVSANEGWAVGGRETTSSLATILHYDGSWNLWTNPATVDLRSVFMVSASEGWAVGDAGTILHFTSPSWVATRTPTTSHLASVYMLNANAGWAVGQGGTILHYDGTSWSTASSPTTNYLHSVHMVSASEGWAVGQGGTILHYDGTSWSTVLPSPTTEDLFSIRMATDGSEGWAVGGGDTILHYAAPRVAGVLSAFGTATTDGVISPGEYGSCIGPVFQGSYMFMICETNDDTNDYYAVQISDLTQAAAGWTRDSVRLSFDNEHDGVVGPRDFPEDQIAVDDLSRFSDGFYSGEGMTAIEAIQDGAGAAVFTPGAGYVYEMSHPLNSGQREDYSLSFGSTVGWCLAYYDSGSGMHGTNPYAYDVQYPAGCYGRGDTTLYGTVLKSPPASWSFDISCDPISVSVTQDGIGTSTCTVTSLNGFTGVVLLSGSWSGTQPTGVTTRLATSANPAPNGRLSFPLTVEASASAPTGGPFMFHVTGTSVTGIVDSTDVPVFVTTGGATGPEAVTLPATDITTTSAVLHGTVNPNGLHTVWHFMDPTGTLEICPVPIGNLPYTDSTPHDVQCMWSPLTPSTHYRYTLQAMNEAGGHAGHVGEFDTQPPPGGPEFSISCDPASVTVPQGVSASSTCAVSSQNGFNAAVALSGAWVGAGGVPTGVTADPVPSSVTPPAGMTVTSILTITPSETASTGSFTYRVTGISGPLSHTSEVTVHVTGAGGAGPVVVTLPATDITATSAVLHGTVNPNGLETTWDFVIHDTQSDTRTYCPEPPGSLGVTSTPQDVSCGATNLIAGRHYEYEIRATDSAGHTSHGAYVSFDTPPAGGAGTPDFSIHCDPSSVTVVQGGRVSSRCTVTSLGGFSAPVYLDGNWLGTSGPAVSGTFSPYPVTPPADGTATSTLTFTADPGCATGPYSYEVTGSSSGTLIHTVDLGVQINLSSPASSTVSTSTAAPPSGVPGFPIEAIVLGLMVGLFALSLRRMRKKSKFGYVSSG